LPGAFLLRPTAAVRVQTIPQKASARQSTTGAKKSALFITSGVPAFYVPGRAERA